MTTTAREAMAALEQAWVTWQGPDSSDLHLTGLERAVRDALAAWIAGGRR